MVILTDKEADNITPNKDSHIDSMGVEDEILDAYNESFGVEKDTVIAIEEKCTQDTSGKTVIGSIIIRKGKIAKYDIDSGLLWTEVLRIIHHRIAMSRGTSCLLNLRTISKQITRQSNIGSIAAVEGQVIRLVSDKFGIKDIEDDEDDLTPEGLVGLRDTIEFWGTVGSRTKHNRKRVARVYQVTDPKGIVSYIEEAIKIEK